MCFWQNVDQSALVLPLSSCPEKFLVAYLQSGIIPFCKMLHFKCSTVFWILLCLDNCSVICTATLGYILHQTLRILAKSALWFLRYMPVYSIILSIIKAYSRILRHYSTPCVTLAYSGTSHILSPGIFRTGGLFETLSNLDQTYSELCHSTLFSHIQAYSEHCATLAYGETWHTRNHGIFRIVR